MIARATTAAVLLLLPVASVLMVAVIAADVVKGAVR